jgi:DNA-binding beta-propeller fold protein YncE
MALSPDGRTMYVPSFEGPHWLVINALTGEVVKKLVVNSGAHNTIYALDGQHAYLAGLKSPLLRVTDTRTHEVAKEIGPFSNVIRPFTINHAGTLCYVNVNGLLGFEIGNLKTGKMVQRVEVQGVEQGAVKRHGCPSHGIGLTPDEKEIWLCDGHNQMIHIFDNTVMPPRQIKSIKLREQPGWITFSLDGKQAWPSTGEIIDVKSKQIIKALSDETGRQVHSEKIVQIDFMDGKPVRAGDQFGLGRRP